MDKAKENNLSRAIEKATFAKNCTPILGSMWSPFTVLTGRPTVLDEARVENLVHQTTRDHNYLHQSSIMDLLEIRRDLQKTEAEAAIHKALTRPLREDVRTMFNHDDAVQIFDQKKLKPKSKFLFPFLLR